MKFAFVGKPRLTPSEEDKLKLLGISIAAARHILVTTDAPGANAAVAEGVGGVGGEVETVKGGAFDGADFSLVYADGPLMERIRNAHPDKDITYITDEDRLTVFLTETIRLLKLRGLI